MANESPDHAPHQGIEPLYHGVPVPEASAAIILIHGRGASPESMIPLAEALASPGTAVILPRAAGNVWYPQRFIAPIEANEPYLSSALQVVADTVRVVEDAGIAPDRLVIGGFSQGACLASDFAARFPRRYGGVLVFSGGLIGPPGTPFQFDGDLRGTPVLVGCSDTDFHIPVERVHETTRTLSQLGGEVTERIYPGMGHTINEDEIDLARRIVSSVG